MLILQASSDSLEGIFFFSYWATQKNQKDFVSITPSSTFWGDPYAIVDYEFTGAHKTDCFATNDEADSNIVFHLLNHSLLLSHYSIKSRPSLDAHYTKNWNIEGSNDGTIWITLDSKRNSDDLVGF